MKSLTIAIPTYNNFKQLIDCLWTLVRYVEYPYNIIVVNNGPECDSVDGSRFEDRVREIIPFPKLKIIQAEKNLGWAGGVNLAFQEAEETDLFCMANDDLCFLPYHQSFLRQLVSHFKFEEVGAVGPSTNFVMGSQSIFDHRGPAVFQTSLLIGFFLVIRSQLFSEIGGLDPGLPGGDDLDLSILVRKKGYQLLVDRTCFVHHIGCQTGYRAFQGWWNSPEHQEVTNNALIRKHGMEWWYETMQSRVENFAPETTPGDAEGDLIRSWVNGGQGLDVGCGGNKTIESAVGVDRTPAGEYGGAGGTKWVKSESDIVAEADDLPFDNESQDYLIARHVFEHLIDPVKALQEWRRVLKPGGSLVVACPDHDRCDSLSLDFTHVHAYNVPALENLLVSQGFAPREAQAIIPGFTFVVRAEKQ